MKPRVIIAALFFTTMVKAQIVNIPDANFKAELIAQSWDLNADGEIQVNEALARTYLEINPNATIVSLEGIQSFTNLTDLRLQSMTSLTSLDITALTNLQYLTLTDLPMLTGLGSLPNLPQLYSLTIGSIPSGTLDFSNLSGVYGISVGYMPSLSSLTVAGNTSIINLSIMSSATLGALNVSGCTGLVNLSVDNASFGSEMVFSSVNLNGCTALKTLNITKTSLTTIDVSSCTALETVDSWDNRIANLDLSGLTHLQTVRAETNAGGSDLRSINVNGCTALASLQVQYNYQLQSIYMKNGSNETLTLFPGTNPNLSFICADESQIAAIQTALNNNGLPATVCNSYCSFVPGGNYNTITGGIAYDSNNNGCDASDPIQPNIKVNLGSPTVGTTFTNNAGNYSFFTDAGTFQWAPDMENASWFTISPTQGNTTFANNNNNTYNQSFCLSANGVHNDLEVVISPYNNARPGFNSSYKIVFKNKGNQTLSGNVNLSFDDSRMDFISAFPNVTAVGTNSLDWAFSNLLPFENRSIMVNFNVSPPPTVNINDILSFTTTITPISGDEIPADNTFTFNQTVVGSYDPNAIRCLEGSSVSTSQIGNYLHYAISFENTGNYQAENVVVKDIIDTAKYDMSTLQLMNTSHNCYTRITGNVVEFIFEGIDLAAVSGNPPVGGHGDVLFKIKSKSNLVSGDQVSKTGKIYFDYNAPITTNIAQTTFQDLKDSIHDLDKSVRVYPNPSNSIVTIHCDSTVKTIELFDIEGRLLETDLLDINDAVLDISSKQSGIYFLRIKTEKGSKVEKIIKE